jgi:DedD protein
VSTTAANAVEEPAPPPAAAQKPAPNPANDPTVAPPPAPVDDVSYPERLEKKNAPAEHLKPVADPPAKSAPAVAKQAPPPAPPPPKETPKATTAQLPAAAEPGGQGFAVQIAALNVRSEADAIARRLSSKGYQAYVLAPPSGTPSVYRVRVGKFPTRREAESMAARLQKEEQFKPWITR